MRKALSSLLSTNEQQAVTRFLELLRQHYPERTLQMILFGSKARGDSRPWSDIDILIVVDQDDWQLSHAISTLGARVSLEYDVLIGPRVIAQERWEHMKQRRFGLYQNVVTEGVPLTPTLPQ